MGDEFTKAGINRETQRHALRGSGTTDKGTGEKAGVEGGAGGKEPRTASTPKDSRETKTPAIFAGNRY